MKNKKIILSAILLLSTTFTFGQIKVENSGRVGIGIPSSFYFALNYPQVSFTDRLTINASGRDRGLVINYDGMEEWYQSITVRNTMRRTANYVVSSKIINSSVFEDVYWVDGNGVCANNGCWNMSDQKLKYDIKPIKSALQKVTSLQGVTYKLKSDLKTAEENKENVGFIAQEVEKVVPELVKELHNGLKAINYSNLVSLLTEAIKEQQMQLESQKTEISNLKVQLETIEGDIKNCCQTLANTTAIRIEESEKTSYLNQNRPNPFNQNTIIEYYISESNFPASINVYDINGHLIRSFNNLKGGKSAIEISSKSFLPGTYVYSLVVGENVIDTKLMMVTK